MAEDTYDSVNAHIIVVENITGDGDFTTGCPIPIPNYGTGGFAAGDIVSLNSMFFIDSAYAAPFDSFANFIVAYPAANCYVVNRNTGELRYYDGLAAGVVTVFWPAELRAVGTINEANATNKRTLERINEFGDKFARDIKAHIHEIDFEFTKVYVDKPKLNPLVRLTDVTDQTNFIGTGLVEGDDLDELVRPKPQRWYMVIVYVLDNSGDAANFARCYIMPCVKFEETRIRSRTKESMFIDIRGMATMAYSIPRDQSKIVDYTPNVELPP